jgi:hypothetical protein
MLLAGCPVIVFDMLSAPEWKNTKPPSALVLSYCCCVANAVLVLNNASVAHMDLRPANIMWRKCPSSESDVEIRVIDLEDAVPFGLCIKSVKALCTDTRYPVFGDIDATEEVIATSMHNEWFCVSVTEWAKSDEENFTAFMDNNYEALKCRFQQYV